MAQHAFDQNLPLLLRFERYVSGVSPFKDMIVGKDYFKKEVKSIEKSLNTKENHMPTSTEMDDKVSPQFNSEAQRELPDYLYFSIGIWGKCDYF